MDIASPPNLDGLISMQKNVDFPGWIPPADVNEKFDVVDVKQEDHEGWVTWTDPKGKLHWLRALVRLALPPVVLRVLQSISPTL